MEAAVIALVGVLVGTAASVGFQIWDRRTVRDAQRLGLNRTASTELLDAVWRRLLLQVTSTTSGPEFESTFTAYSAARTRFADSDAEDALLFTTWVDLTLTLIEEQDPLTMHDALARHGHIMERLQGWQVQDVETVADVRAEQKDLRARYWGMDEDDDDDGVVTPSTSSQSVAVVRWLRGLRRRHDRRVE